MTNTPDSTQRFSSRVADYVKYRPDYPRAILAALHDAIGLSPEWVVADIGSGTGISSRLFLENGNSVFGVEPNDDMRAAAEQMLVNQPRFRSIKGTAEATTLPEASVDLVVAGQAFHWFNRDQAKHEFRRILRPRGWCMLMWNQRILDGTPFLKAYEELLLKYGTDYSAIRHENIDEPILRTFFSSNGYQTLSIPNQQVFDLDGIIGRCLSSSYVPHKGHPNYQPMLTELTKAFESHECDGQVSFLYETQLYFSVLA